MTYDQKKQELTKNAYVYLPYGNSDEKQYNVFYLMHGGWSDETTMLGTDRYYRKSFMGTAARAWIENTFDLRPALAAKPGSLDQYDTIYVGYPIWWFNAPMAIGTFLESYGLSGKTIVPFCTSQNNDISITMDYIRKAAGNATVLDGLRIHNMELEDIQAWLNEIGIDTSESTKKTQESFS